MHKILLTANNINTLSINDRILYGDYIGVVSYQHKYYLGVGGMLLTELLINYPNNVYLLEE
jgi:hypothetical protein